ncbi:MAG: hypothetical protein RR216_05000, partial [Pseudoflavonifractor sp.]
MSGEKKKQQPDRRANSIILRRTLVLMGICGVLAFFPLLTKLYEIQIIKYDEYKGLAIDQQTRDVAVAANRGT